MFIRQLSDLVAAGVPLSRALSLIEKQSQHPGLREVVPGLLSLVRDVAMFSQALADFPRVFPELYVQIVRAGELSGDLGRALDSLAGILEEEQELYWQISSVLVYPALVLFASGTGAGLS